MKAFVRLFRMGFALWLLPTSLYAQSAGEHLDEEMLRAQTKQVNQFFRRFNCEEDLEGNRLYEGDALYHNQRMREDYLSILFDNQTGDMPRSLKEEFIQEVAGQNQYLDFHGGDWFAEVEAQFWYEGRKHDVILFLRLEEAKVGSKWVIFQLSFPSILSWFEKDTTAVEPFLHPMSHELGFMNLFKAFRNQDELPQYTDHDFFPDQLTLFLYESKKNALRFETVKGVKFHFVQLDGWYFELNKFTRAAYNSGWLISHLARTSDKEKRELLEYVENGRF